MKQNPVYKREARINARSMKLCLTIAGFNGILAVTVLLNMYSVVSQARAAATIQYSSFLDIYEFAAAIEFIMLMFIVPAVTAAGISGERERQTLEILLTTQMKPSQIVAGKLMSSLSTLFLLIVSSLPMLLMVFVFGGIRVMDLLALFLCCGTAALLGGCLGIFFSSVFKRSVIASALTYGVLVILTGGTYFLNRFIMGLSTGQLSQPVVSYSFGTALAQPTSGGMFYLFLLNPGATFFTILQEQTGRGSGVECLQSLFGVTDANWVTRNWTFLSIGLQLAVSAILLAAAIRQTDPLRRRSEYKK